MSKKEKRFSPKASPEERVYKIKYTDTEYGSDHDGSGSFPIGKQRVTTFFKGTEDDAREYANNSAITKGSIVYNESDGQEYEENGRYHHPESLTPLSPDEVTPKIRVLANENTEHYRKQLGYIEKRLHEEAREAKAKKIGLRKILGTILIIISLLFLSPNITGNAIANINTSNSNIIGAIFFTIGLIGGFFWLKSSKNN